eukprot:458188_1
MLSFSKKRRRKYKRLKQKLKEIETLKLLQHERTLSNEELEKLNKENIYQQQVKKMYIKPVNQTQNIQSIDDCKNENTNIIGSYAFLKDLIQFKMYNGKVVKIVDYFALKQRYKVRLLPKHTEYFLVRHNNLLPIKESVEDSKLNVDTQQYIKDHKPLKTITLPRVKLSIKQKHLLLISGFINIIIKPLIFDVRNAKMNSSVSDEIINVILYYTSLLPVINIDNDFMVNVSVYDSVAFFKKHVLNLYSQKFKNWNEQLDVLFKFGNVNDLIYPLTVNKNYKYDYDRFVKIPPDEEDNIILGDIAICGKLDVMISDLWCAKFDVDNLRIGDFVRVYTMKYGWLDSVIKYIKKNNVYLHYIGYDAKYDEIIYIYKLIENGITKYYG